MRPLKTQFGRWQNGKRVGSHLRADRCESISFANRLAEQGV
ncbi:MAG TPA: hypothetical protein VKV03_13740 [Candidatus Binataceae bacterium]|nr:hypothetical protein [Candidatus Binataceae bacterium]